MRKNPLPTADKVICRRLRELRDKLGLTIEGAAREVGITYHLWHSMEMLRAPLRSHVGFKICRQLIVSEEWLATGAFAKTEAAAAKRSIGKDKEIERFYLRQAVDMQAEPEFLDLDPRMLFRDAFHSLEAKFGELVDTHFHMPRIAFRDADSDDLIVRYIEVINQRWLRMIENEACRISRGQGLARRQFLRYQVEIGTVLFKRFIKQPTPEIKERRYDFLRALANDTEYPLGPLYGGTDAAFEMPQEESQSVIIIPKTGEAYWQDVPTNKRPKSGSRVETTEATHSVKTK